VREFGAGVQTLELARENTHGAIVLDIVAVDRAAERLG
jgi:hypothetical protein